MNSLQIPETVDQFDALYAQSDDPWHIERGWYEERKRALLMACLPRKHFGVILEPGCGTGALSILLASRCQLLIATDIAPRAIALAHQRLAASANVKLSCERIPDEWPAGLTAASVDCVVISELCYYLQPQQFSVLLARIAHCLKPDGVIVACHWRHAFDGKTMSANTIHDRIGSSLALHQVSHHEEPDFLLDVWCSDGRSVATREGLR